MADLQPATPPAVVVLDLGGVVFGYDHQRRLDRLSQLTGQSPAALDALFWKSGFSDACDSGRIGTADDVRREIRSRLRWDGPAEPLDVAWCSTLLPDPAIVRLLATRARPGPRLAGFTNNGPLEELTFPLLHPDVFALFEAVFFSHRLGATKPSQQAYAPVTAELDVQPETIAFFDDNADNVAGARRAGWQATVFEGAGDLAFLANPQPR